MPIKRPQLINGEIYHVVARGVEKRDIFLDVKDKVRFIHNLFQFNDEKPVLWAHRGGFRSTRSTGSDPVGLNSAEGLRKLEKRRERKLLVEILSFCLMPNHFHLLIRQLKDKGISEFMKKISGGYAVYFNKKYERDGHLFQGKFRAVLIKNEDQLKNVFVYVHANPIDLIEPGWKEKGIENPKKTIEFLENYRWSSYLDYIGKKNFPSLTKRELFYKILNRSSGCREYLENWIMYKAEIKELDQVALE